MEYEVIIGIEIHCELKTKNQDVLRRSGVVRRSGQHLC